MLSGGGRPRERKREGEKSMGFVRKVNTTEKGEQAGGGGGGAGGSEAGDAEKRAVVRRHIPALQ
jgi:hypothetical protein